MVDNTLKFIMLYHYFFQMCASIDFMVDALVTNFVEHFNLSFDQVTFVLICIYLTISAKLVIDYLAYLKHELPMFFPFYHSYV